MTTYPSTLPCPRVDDYKGEVDFGLSSVTFNHGNTRRRRLATYRLERYDLSLTCSTRDLWNFTAWANQVGYDWYYMPIVTHYSGFMQPSGPILHRCRMTSDINVTALGSDTFKVKLSIEIDPSTRPLGIVIPSGNWIIGGTPPAPSSPAQVVANTPATAPPDIIAAGTPALPAA